MKAAVLSSPGRLEVREVPEPRCPEGGVRVRIKACGICTADIKMAAQGHRALTYPRIPGHEMAGIVVESRHPDFAFGDRVQVGPGLRCGVCFRCRSGNDNQCPQREILGFSRDGGFAETIALPLQGSIIGALNPLPDHVGFAEATLAEPLACCINAQQKLPVGPGDTVLIMGAGTLGLLHGFVARHYGASTILMADPCPERRDIAARYFADQTFDPEAVDFFERIRRAAKGSGVDVLIFASSAVGPDDCFLDLTAPNARISVFCGTAPPVTPAALDLNQIHYKELVITGAYGCTASQNALAIDLIAGGRLPWKTMITRQLPLNRIQEGLVSAAPDKNIKTIVEL